MKQRITKRAQADARRILHYIAHYNPVAAFDVVNDIFAAADLLVEQPRIGHAGKREGTLEHVVARWPDYIIVYRIDDARREVVVIRITHAARKPPS